MTLSETGQIYVTLAAATTKGNRNTLKVHLRSLVEGGYLKLHGERRGAWYEVARNQEGHRRGWRNWGGRAWL